MLHHPPTHSLQQAALEQAPFGVLLWPAEGEVFVNASLRQMLYMPVSASLSPSRLENLFNSRSLDGFLGLARRMLAGDSGLRHIELQALRGDGELLKLEAEISPIREAGRISLMAVFRDATVRQLAQQSLNRLAYHDSLTGLPNRALFLDRLNQSLRRGIRNHSGFSLMSVDLDGFKAINDTYGHEAGDAVLRGVACTLQGLVRETDTVARLGGDEFAIILNDSNGFNAALHVAAQIHTALSNGLLIANTQLPIGASIGIACYPEHGADMHSLMVAADTAMYDAKTHAKGTSRYQATRRAMSFGISPLALQWSAELEFGVAQIDLEHRGMVESINAVVSAYSAAADIHVIRNRMDAFIALASSHFQNEEAYMSGLSEAERLQHCQAHARSLSELKQVREALDVSGVSQTIQFISNWLFEHIRHADRHLCETYLA